MSIPIPEMLNHQLMPPSRQSNWRWPAVFNFFLGGTGTGLYVNSLFMATIAGAAVSKPALMDFLTIAIILLGFLCLFFETGRPLRSRHLFGQLRYSWISREALALALFITAVLLAQTYSHPALSAVAAITALLMMISQGFIVYQARAVTAWNVPIMPLLFITSGLTTGFGLLLVIASLVGISLVNALIMNGIILLILDMTTFNLYLRWSNKVAFLAAVKSLCSPLSMILNLGLGHVLPILLLLLLMADITPAGTRTAISVILGFFILTGGISQKASIILGAGYTREITIKVKE